MSSIVQPHFWNEEAAHAKLGRMVWPNGPDCPHCSNSDRIGSVTGKGARTGLKLCHRCRKQFRVTMATIFDSSHVPLQKWLQACFLLSCCDRRITAHQLHLKLEVTNKTALRMVQRLDPLATRIRREFRGSEAEMRRPRAGGAEAQVWAEAVGLALAPPPGNGHGERRFSGPPTRQFLGFVEMARSLGYRDDDEAFDTMLAASKRSLRRVKTVVELMGRAAFALAPSLSTATA
jgi:transposase-like protein